MFEGVEPVARGTATQVGAKRVLTLPTLTYSLHLHALIDI